MVMKMLLLLLLASFSELPPSAFIEGFEAAPVTDETYNHIVIEQGNSLNPDFPTSLIGSPEGWGAQCGRVNIGPNNGAAVWMQEAAIGNTKGYYTHANIRIDYEGLKDSQGNTILIAKPQGDPLGPVAAWRLYLFQLNREVFFLWAVGDFARFYRYPTTGSILLDKVYDQWIVYDLKNHVIGWYVNGNQFVWEAMPATFPDNIATKAIGSSGSGTGRNLRYYVDNVWWVEVP
jgi:hypothetical protein